MATKKEERVQKDIAVAQRIAAIGCAVALRQQGKTAADIQRATGLSYYHQRKLYNAHNIPAPSRYGATRRAILELLDAGEMSQSEIARTLGVSRQLVSEVKRIELKKEVDSK